jgi:hypothetical protein
VLKSGFPSNIEEGFDRLTRRNFNGDYGVQVVG